MCSCPLSQPLNWSLVVLLCGILVGRRNTRGDRQTERGNDLPASRQAEARINGKRWLIKSRFPCVVGPLHIRYGPFEETYRVAGLNINRKQVADGRAT